MTRPGLSTREIEPRQLTRQSGYSRDMESGDITETQQVGIRDLRDGLSRYVDAARSGAIIVVTDHGRPVAEIRGLESSDPLDDLIRRGVVTPAATKRKALPRRLCTRVSVSDLVAEQRG